MRAFLVAVLLGASVTAEPAWAMRWRTPACVAAVGAAALSVALLMPRQIDALRLGIPRRPVTEAQLQFGGFSSDPLVNLRQSVENRHGVLVRATIAGPDAVLQDELGRFLTDFLDACAPDPRHEKPMLLSLSPPRTVTVVGGKAGAIVYEDDTVRVHWSQAAALVREEKARIVEANELINDIQRTYGVELLPDRATIPFERYVDFLRRFRVAAMGLTREDFARANFDRDVVLVSEPALASRRGLDVPRRSLAPLELDSMLRDLRERRFRLPDLRPPPPAGVGALF